MFVTGTHKYYPNALPLYLAVTLLTIGGLVRKSVTEDMVHKYFKVLAFLHVEVKVEMMAWNLGGSRPSSQRR